MLDKFPTQKKIVIQLQFKSLVFSLVIYTLLLKLGFRCFHMIIIRQIRETRSFESALGLCLITEDFWTVLLQGL